MLQISRRDDRLALRALFLLLLASLLVAISATAAHAEEPTGQWAPEGQEAGAGTPPSQEPAGEGGQEAVPPGTEPGAGEAPQGSAEAPPAEGQEAAPVEAQPAPPSEPVGEAAPPPSEPAEQPAPPIAPAPEGGETQSTPPVGGKVEEQVQGKAAGQGEETTGTLSTHPNTLEALTSAVAHTPTPEAPPATDGQQLPAIAQPAVSAERETAQASTSRHGALSANKQAGRFSCELSALGGSMTDNCSAGWLAGSSSAPATVTPASAALAAVSSLAPVATGTSPTGTEHGSFVSSGPPLTPAPGPAPSGASGSAGASASGAGISIFLTLAGLLLLGAPRAMRRLRLSFEPWLAGCFVLIPERPD